MITDHNNCTNNWRYGAHEGVVKHAHVLEGVDSFKIGFNLLLRGVDQLNPPRTRETINSLIHEVAFINTHTHSLDFVREAIY